MYKVGAIINTHGIKGEVKVKRTGDFAERFEVGNELFYQNAADDTVTLLIKSSRMQNEIHLLGFDGLHSIDDVLPLKSTTLYIKNAQLTELSEHEFYYHEIIGCKVTTTCGQTLGVVEAILSPGANDVWVVKTPEGTEHLIPYIADVVKEVDVNDKTILIELMEGLID